MTPLGGVQTTWTHEGVAQKPQNLITETSVFYSVLNKKGSAQKSFLGFFIPCGSNLLSKSIST